MLCGICVCVVCVKLWVWSSVCVFTSSSNIKLCVRRVGEGECVPGPGPGPDPLGMAVGEVGSVRESEQLASAAAGWLWQRGVATVFFAAVPAQGSSAAHSP